MAEFKDKEENGPIAFFRRLKKNVTESVARPVPGILKMTRTSESEDNLSSTNNNNNSSSSNVKNSTTVKSQGKINDASKKKPETSSYKMSQFQQLMNSENLDVKALRKLSWNGIPNEYRPEVWQLLLGYLPINKERRESAIARKRKEYLDSIPMYFNVSEADRTTQEGEILRQILVDLPRTCPNTPFFHQTPIQRAMERILYIWSIRHPASGYVQGMNDLLTPLLLICIQPFVQDPLRCDVGSLDSTIVSNVEADSYWCLTKLLDNIQDHYTFSQPGLQRMILRLEDLICRIDKDLHLHFQNEGLMYMQFSFRWMNCILLRELPLKAIMRLWDTYISEETSGFENFHVYVCAVLLKTYKEQLMTMQFQEILMFLQDLPTSDWNEEDVEPILSQAFILSTLFDNSPSHLG